VSALTVQSQQAVEIAVGRNDVENQHVLTLNAIQDDVPADRKNSQARTQVVAEAAYMRMPR